jgi:hypothetical protein
MPSDGSVRPANLSPSGGAIALHGSFATHNCPCEQYMYEKSEEARGIFDTLD